MARIKLALPSTKSIFLTSLPLMVNFINYGGHMGNDAILTLAQEARLRFLRSHDYSELNFFGASLIQADAAIVYKGEGFLGDELEVELFIDDLNEYGFDFFYIFKNQKNQKEIARAKTGMVFFNYELRKMQKAPDEFLNKYSSISS